MNMKLVIRLLMTVISAALVSVFVVFVVCSYIGVMGVHISPNSRLWKFSVIHQGEMEGKMYITGDCDSLGNWQSSIFVPLEYDEISKVWSVEKFIPSDRDVHYRYYTGTKDDTFDSPKMILHQWETHLRSRLVEKIQKLQELNQKADIFGIVNGIHQLENGWLTDATAVELSVYRNSLHWLPECSDKKINIKLKRSTRSQCSGNSTRKPKYDESSGNVLISLSNENGKFRKQDENGYPHAEVEYAVFATRTFSLEQQGFIFEFIDMGSGEIAKKYFSYLMFEKFHGSEGTVKIPINSPEQEYLGSLSVKYLIVRPSPEINCSFKVSFAKYWNNSWSGMEIGHRGAGSSFSLSLANNNSKWRENTIGSFKSAAQNGARMVEFDVQLTNDMVPAIFHDFHVLLKVRSRSEPSKGKILPFHELTYEELKNFQVYHVNEMNATFSFENDDQEDYSPFPSLKQVLRAVDPLIGFNIEIKYTCVLEDGKNEDDHPIDMNEYVDKILQVVFAHADRRYIVFSSFNADVCAMTRLKQNKYPVMFLTQGVTSIYEPYSDPRMKNVENAINFANSEDLLGLVVHSENLLSDSKLVKLVLNNNLVLFCWGRDNNNKDTIAKFKQQGVHGIIFDRYMSHPHYEKYRTNLGGHSTHAIFKYLRGDAPPESMSLERS